MATREKSRRLRGERGAALVTALVLLFAFTAGGVIWLSRDVNRRVSNRSAAQSIAFQAARSGAQQVEVQSLRAGGGQQVTLREDDAREQAARVASRLFDEFEVDGEIRSISFPPPGDIVRVEVVIRDTSGDVVGTGTAQAVPG